MRADTYLVTQKYVDSRTRAAKMIENGWIIIDGKRVKKPAEDIDADVEHNVVITGRDRFVGRGGLKLEAAITRFCIDADGLVFADIGASTGGFTQCLLQHGAKKVYAVDSGKGQLHPDVASDPRVVSIEGFNARYITENDIGAKVDAAVMDVSFISQTCIIPALCNIIKPDGFLISLIKPQFEAGRAAVGKNGIVKKPSDRESAVRKVFSFAVTCGMLPEKLIQSPITGGDGNTEYLALFRKCADISWYGGFEDLISRIF